MPGKTKWDGLVKGACIAVVGLAIVWTFVPRVKTQGIKPVAERIRKMPDFALPALDGKVWKLSEHRGSVVLVNFWATWCPPCRAEMPGLARVSRELSSGQFIIAGIALDDDGSAAVKPFIERHPTPYPILLPPAVFPLGNGIESLPTSILVDREGRVAKVYVGQLSERELKRDAEILLAEPAAQSGSLDFDGTRIRPRVHQGTAAADVSSNASS
ncbi:MAG TPA: TlpA disulfide reductase family protein [Bryobacteraceae bacterium]|nr:TlpA disulfide reductase family protein [Bryobacteraceae bacterium]